MGIGIPGGGGGHGPWKLGGGGGGAYICGGKGGGAFGNWGYGGCGCGGYVCLGAEAERPESGGEYDRSRDRDCCCRRGLADREREYDRRLGPRRLDEGLRLRLSPLLGLRLQLPLRLRLRLRP